MYQIGNQLKIVLCSDTDSNDHIFHHIAKDDKNLYEDIKDSSIKYVISESGNLLSVYDSKVNVEFLNNSATIQSDTDTLNVALNELYNRFSFQDSSNQLYFDNNELPIVIGNNDWHSSIIDYEGMIELSNTLNVDVELLVFGLNTKFTLRGH